MWWNVLFVMCLFYYYTYSKQQLTNDVLPSSNISNFNLINSTLSLTARSGTGSWSVFTVVKFANQGCKTDLGRGGTCYTQNQCVMRGGIPSGECARGFGVCCMFHVSCGGMATENCTYFVNPGYPNRFVLPNGQSAQCDFQVIRCRPDICQIRLDFVNFELFGVQNGECQVDVFNTFGSRLSSRLPMICGLNTGQHVYLDFPPGGSDVINLRTSLGFLFDNPEFGRTFEIKVTQIECSSPLLAPSGCLQYYTGISGAFKSFNYVMQDELREGYPNNMNYGICIRKELGFCSIQYSSSGPFQFGISSEADTTALAGDNCKRDATDGGSRDDFLVIPGGSGLLPEPETADRYCGGNFATITTSVMPYIINVVSGDKSDGEAGFMLNYQQIACPSSG